jgi:hypothetical protein
VLVSYERVIEHTIDLGFLGSITTNGSNLDSLLDNVHVDKLRKLAWIGIDIDAGTQPLYEQIRRSLTAKSLFSKVCDNARGLIQAGVNVDFKCLVNPLNDNEEAMAACKNFLLNELAPHLSGLDSAPQGVILDTPYALSQTFNGDARRAMLALQEAGQDVSKWKWGVGAPTTELWMDTYCIVKGARHKEAAYDYINFMLDPLNSAREAMFIGSHTGSASLEAMLPSELPFKEFMSFTPEEVARMVPGKYSKGLDTAIAIHEELRKKASAGTPVKG